MKRSAAPFYLTGGTALSRRWFAHRYSDDLDLFVDSDPRYPAHVEALFAVLKEAEGAGELVVDQQRLRRSPWHTQPWVAAGGRAEAVELKVDLVNDTAPRVGATESDPVVVHGILRSVPPEELARVAWSSSVDLQRVRADCAVMADDILFSRRNSLCPPSS